MATPSLPKYLPLPEAAQKLGLDASQLLLLVESGKIDAAQMPDGDVMVREDELNKGNGELPRYLLLSDAAQQYDLDANLLTRMVEKGELTAVTGPDSSVMVDENQIKAFANRPRKEDLPEYKKHVHLKGVGIGIAEAARKYDLVFSSVRRWAEAGYIARIGTDKNKVLLDEADVAYCAEVYRQRSGQGKWLFNPDGTPYQLKSETG